MKKLVSYLAVALLFVSVASCEKDKGLLPNIAFITTDGYTYQDGAVSVGSDLKAGITASKAEDKDVLTKFTVTRSVNGGAEEEVLSEDLTGEDGNSFSADVNFTTGSTPGTEKYTFTVVNRDGLINNVRFTLTVN